MVALICGSEFSQSLEISACADIHLVQAYVTNKVLVLLRLTGQFGKQQVRRSPDEWRAILERFERSGQSHREFCLAEDLAPSTFSWWRRKLRRLGPNGTAVDGAVFVDLAADRPELPAWLFRSDLDRARDSPLQ